MLIATVSAFVVANAKLIPGMWHMRIVGYFMKNLYLCSNIRAQSVYESQTYRTLVPLLELDYNMHKNNGTYFGDMDMSRFKLITYLLRRFLRYYNDHSVTGGKYEFKFIPLGAENLVFLNEIGAYKWYDVRTRVIGWDQKWIWLLTTFESTDRQTIYAHGLSKMVFKQRRKTIPPSLLFEYEGLLTPEAIQRNERLKPFLENTLDVERALEVERTPTKDL